jgi:hypothetical protein
MTSGYVLVWVCIVWVRKVHKCVRVGVYTCTCVHIGCHVEHAEMA